MGKVSKYQKKRTEIMNEMTVLVDQLSLESLVASGLTVTVYQPHRFSDERKAVTWP